MRDLIELLEDAERQLGICNACRYCEGYCAVFPAAERRSAFAEGDITFLANLCHDCRACYQACMYSPPHEFAVNLPAVLSEARTTAYARYAWPRWLARAFSRHPGAAVGIGAIGLVMMLLSVWLSGNWADLLVSHTGEGAFYEVVPHLLMAIPSSALGVFIALVLFNGFVMFWRGAGGRWYELLDLRAWGDALAAAGSHRYFSGAGGGCYYPDRETASGARRVLHAAVAYGFLAAFLATVVAAGWQYLLGREAPYPVLSPPVLLGSLGGIGMIVGCTGLLALKRRADHELGVPEMRRMDVAFLVVLDLSAITGMLTLALRETAAMGTMLVVHLAVLSALYVTAPYGKFVHFVYRLAALVLDRVEDRRSLPALATRRPASGS